MGDFVIENGKLKEYTGSGGDVVIPDGVTGIDENAFRGCRSLTSVVIPVGVKRIGNNAFRDCQSLTSVIMHEGMKRVGHNAFRDCSCLNAIVIPDGVTNIGNSAFYSCSSLKCVVIPNSVVSVGSHAFQCYNRILEIHMTDLAAYMRLHIGYTHKLYINDELVTEAVIPDNVTSIGDSAFSGCRSLTSVVIPNSVTGIGSYAFGGCSSLTGMVIPDSVTSIGDNAFGGCSSLTGMVIPDSVTSIGSYAFNNCRSLTSIVLSNSVTSIGSYAFDNCRSLRSIAIPDGVTSIGEYAFNLCERLRSIAIPNSVTSIGSHAFDDCRSLTSIVLPNSVTDIGSCAFLYTSLTSIVIPDSVTSIGDHAFSCCGLTSAVIPASVKSIGECAFGSGFIIIDEAIMEHLNLSSEMFGSNVYLLTKNISSIPARLRANAAVSFAENARFEDVDRASYLEYIKSHTAKLVDKAMEHPALLAVMCNEKLITAKNIALYTEAAQKTGRAEPIAMMLEYNSNVPEINNEMLDDEIFERMLRRQNKIGIDGLNFVVTGKLKTFEKRSDMKAFIESKGAKLLNSVSSKVDYHIINSEESADEEHKNCDDLGIEIISEYKFNELAGRAFWVADGVLKKYCIHGTDAVIPDSVTSIGELAFCNCHSLTSVIIPSNVTSIGNNAFYGCDGLTDIVIPDGVTSIGDRAFRYCSSLTFLEIPDSVISIGSEVFDFCSKLVIRAHEGSYAAKYADENGIKIEKIPTPPRKRAWLQSVLSRISARKNPDSMGNK